MSSIGSNSPELLIELDRAQPRGLRSQIEEALRTSIRAGRLPAGTRLPSSRALAADLRVTRGVVVSAFEQLAAEGYVTSRTGSGTVVNDIAPPVPKARAERGRPDVTYDLRPAVPDLDLFPRSAWNRASRSAMNTMPRDDLGYVDVRGLPRLRETIADYLARVRGVSTSPDRVMVCNGFVHGFGLVLEALRGRGVEVVATEDPGYEDQRLVATRLGLEVRAISVDDDGLDSDALGASSAGAVVLTPAHQSPTGVVLSAERRTAIADWARATNGYIIEDDYDAEFRYDRQPIGALQGLVADRTIYIGTLSKCLSPGLRMGWLVLPPELVEPVMAVRSLVDGVTSTIDQATFAEFLVRGDLDRHLRRSRRLYRRRRDALIDALAAAVPDAVPGIVAAGLHLPLYLPREVDERRVLDEARALGVLVAGMEQYRATPRPSRPTLVVGFGRIATDDAPRAAALIADAIGWARRGGPTGLAEGLVSWTGGPPAR